MHIKATIQKLSIALGIVTGIFWIIFTAISISTTVSAISYGRPNSMSNLLLTIIFQVLLLIVELLSTALASALLCGFAEIVAYAHSRTLPNSSISFDVYNNGIVELTNLSVKDEYTSKLNEIACAAEKDRTEDAYYHHSVEK